jgi:hypothetical protein
MLCATPLGIGIFCACYPGFLVPSNPGLCCGSALGFEEGGERERPLLRSFRWDSGVAITRFCCRSQLGFERGIGDESELGLKRNNFGLCGSALGLGRRQVEVLWITAFVFASRGVLGKLFGVHDLDLVGDVFCRGAGGRAKWR